MFRVAMVLLVFSAALLAGCGGDDENGTERLGKEEFASRANEINSRVDRAFGQVFAKLGQRDDKERVPEAVKADVRDAARVERQVASELGSLKPPQDAEEPVQDLVAAAGAQADALDKAAADPELTVGALADVFEQGAVQQPLAELETLGYLPKDESR